MDDVKYQMTKSSDIGTVVSPAVVPGCSRQVESLCFGIESFGFHLTSACPVKRFDYFSGGL
jgi:hypothetical protein